MMRRIAAIGLALITCATTARAAELVPPAAQEQQEQPCTRGQRTFTIGGIDIDVMKCQLLLYSARLTGLQAELNQTQAGFALLNGDLKQRDKQIGEQAALTAYWKAYGEGAAFWLAWHGHVKP